MHTRECLEEQGKLATARARWLASWPKHCKICEGSGEQPIHENNEPGQDCACVMNAICPRCGYRHGSIDQFNRLVETKETTRFYKEGRPCHNCGWNWGRSRVDVCPPAFDGCACAVEAEEKKGKTADDGELILYATGVVEAYNGLGELLAIRSEPGDLELIPEKVRPKTDTVWFLNAPDLSDIHEGDRISVYLRIERPRVENKQESAIPLFVDDPDFRFANLRHKTRYPLFRGLCNCLEQRIYSTWFCPVHRSMTLTELETIASRQGRITSDGMLLTPHGPVVF